MNHWALFRRSWSILWQNKTLWVFGLLAALGGGFSFNLRVGEVRPMTDLPLGARELLRSILSASDFTTLIGIGLAIGVVTFVLATFAQAALISMVNAIAAGQPVSVGDGVQAGARRFLPLLLTRFLLALPLLIIGILAAQSFFSAFSSLLTESDDISFGLGELGAVTALGGLAFVIGLLVSAVSIGAERAVVLEEMPVWPAIAHGWRLLWSKFADYFSIALIFFVLAILAGIVFVCALLPILFVSVIPSLDQLRSGINVFTFTTNIAGPAALILILVGLIIGSLVAVFTSSVWTLAYSEWRASATAAETESTV
ncbi:MAG: hypothetical protein ACRDGG_01665 [Anaerolineae bacterium]